LFINYNEFWNGEPSEEEYKILYRRKPRAPYIEASFDDGSSEKIWCTFGEEQVDLNLAHPKTKEFILANLKELASRGFSLIRLDAVAYATKRPGTACFFVEPDIWELLKWIGKNLSEFGIDFLPEIHLHYSVQVKLASRGYWTYDFALPMLTLHALYSGTAEHLAHWFSICPRRQFTILDTHDGIGVLDVKGLLSDEEIEFTKNAIFKKGANVKQEYNTPDYNNLDIYQINCTYYSALGDNDNGYLTARALQMFAPGIPQVYYVGLLAGRNDIKYLEETREGRNINRHYYNRPEIIKELKRPVVRSLLKMMEFRNTCGAFSLDSEYSVSVKNKGKKIIIRRNKNDVEARLEADLSVWDFEIFYKESNSEPEKKLTLYI
jgi:sucrose phosphorylase